MRAASDFNCLHLILGCNFLSKIRFKLTPNSLTTSEIPEHRRHSMVSSSLTESWSCFGHIRYTVFRAFGDYWENVIKCVQSICCARLWAEIRDYGLMSLS